MNRLRRWRRGSRPPFLMITLSNVRSCNNKLDELPAKATFEEEEIQSNLLYRNVAQAGQY